jgi:uncharacterized protein with HEPN domain
MSRTSLIALLVQMKDYADLALSYIDGMGELDFLRDTKTQQAVAMNLINVGEAATKILRDHRAFSERHPDIRWRGMLAMRNRIAHNYSDLDFQIVWETTTVDLRDLARHLPTLIRDADSLGSQLDEAK